MAAAAKKNRKNLSSELELELQTGKQGEEEEAGKEVVDDDGGDDIGDDGNDSGDDGPHPARNHKLRRAACNLLRRHHHLLKLPLADHNPEKCIT